MLGPEASPLLHRRGFLAAWTAAAITACAPTPRPSRGIAVTGGEPLGVQLYSVGAQATADLDATLAGLARIGYRTVELAGYLGRTPADLRAALDRARLRCVSSAHVGPQLNPPGSRRLDEDPKLLAEDARILGFDTVVMPLFNFPEGASLTPGDGEDFRAMIARIARGITREGWRAQADFMNAKAAELRRHGLRFAYHNHNLEFAPLGDATVLEILLRSTDPSLVAFELDVGWAAAAGVDAARLIEAHPRRFTALHVKDVKATTKANFELRQDPAELGQGVIDWRRVMAAARRAGIKRFFVEHEAPFAYPPLESLRMNYDYLAGLRA